MPAIATKKLSENVGVEVLDADADRLINDPDIPNACMDALEHNGVLLFRELHLTDAEQVAFCRRLGDLVLFPRYEVPEVMVISFDPDNPNRKYFESNDYWHLDGSLDEIPAKASIMSAHVTAEQGGETAFASTYAAYDALSDEEKDEFADLQVVHSMAAIQRRGHPNPSDQQEADWARVPTREHPLVWTHESGRKSLVFGATADHIVGRDVAEGRKLLLDLEDRATATELVYQHTWSVGDLVIWDNRGLLHKACRFDRNKPREMHRSTLAGDEPIK